MAQDRVDPGYRCTSDRLAVDTAFPGGALDSCAIDADGLITIVIAPEDAPPINCSPWYAFRITPLTPEATAATVRLSYTACGHRYHPKTSTDFASWEQVPPARLQLEEAAAFDSARIALPLGNAPVFVAAQEVLPQETYDNWMAGKVAAGVARGFVLGESAEGRTIGGIEIGDAAAREVVVLVGRQHPPEVTGAFAMFAFMETLLADTPLAQAYRARFETLAVPILNPDGVARGHWRHSTGGVDLNRDWGPFTQPETQAMRDLLGAIERDGARSLRLLLDFHSTGRDVFYTIPDELPTNPAMFTRDWLARYQQLMPGYDVVRDATHEVGGVVSKAYTYDTFGVPSITFELGDDTDRELLRRIGMQSAIAMMETALASAAP